MQYVEVPNPNATLDASGEQKLISKSGPFSSIFFVNNLLLSKLANNLFTLFFPPCFPIKIGLIEPNFLIPLTCSYFLDVQRILCCF